MKTCTQCKDTFEQRSNVQKRCDVCRTKVCLFCSKSFVSPQGNIKQKYCSKLCGVLGHSEKLIILQKNRGTKPRTYHLRTDVRPKHGGIMYTEWRSAVYKRDDYTCQECKQKGGRLNADHIKSWADYPDSRYELSNGRTLCVPCHKKTDTYGWQKYHACKRLEQSTLL